MLSMVFLTGCTATSTDKTDSVAVPDDRVVLHNEDEDFMLEPLELSPEPTAEK